MDPDNNPEQGNRYSIRQSLQELWRGLTFFFNRSPQEPVEVPHTAQPVENEFNRSSQEPGGAPHTAQLVENELEAKWRQITEMRKRAGELAEESKVTGDLGPATQALEELKLRTANFESLVKEMQAPIRAILGKNFLGVEEWQRGFGFRVGVPPPIPESITAELLNSKCPLHPGQLIKDTHILMLIPKTVDGQPYTALKLAELCAGWRGIGTGLIFDRIPEANAWKSEPWAKKSPVESKWVLVPKCDPDPEKVPPEKHFRGKAFASQLQVYTHYEADYRGAKALEVMTAAVLNCLVNGERILANYSLRIKESYDNKSFRPIETGNFHPDGLAVSVGMYFQGSHPDIGLALARKV